MTQGEGRVTAAQQALARGEPLIAHDLAQRGLAAGPRDARLAHTLVLALARSGATERAEAEYERLDLASMGAEDPALRVDVLALHARLAKDRARRSSGTEARRWAAVAADRYAEASGPADSAYAHVNAATMALWAGERERAVQHARLAVAHVDDDADPADAMGGYWRNATLAEAHLVLGEPEQAGRALDEAAALAGDDLAAKATTRRQLGLLEELGAASAGLIDRLPMPGVIAYGGHRLTEDAPAEAETRPTLAEVLHRGRADIGYGSLACGADILWAEALLDRDAELHVTLPFDVEEFIETSVRPGGEGWVGRYRAVSDAATSVSVSSPGPYLGDDELYAYAARWFMGRAVIRARALTVEPRFTAISDGGTATGSAGTGADLDAWREAGYPVDVVAPVSPRLRGGSAPTAGPRRTVRAALFGDFQGFSRLSDADLPAFVEQSLTALSTALDAAGDDVLFRNSWGDGIFVVCSTVRAAARLAVGLQESVKASGADTAPDLRLGGHAGPMFALWDPIQQRETYFGRAVVTAARIEPRTPEGEVYVTEPFAALLELEPTSGIEPEYVGPIATAKGFGDLPMYVLKSRSPGA